MPAQAHLDIFSKRPSGRLKSSFVPWELTLSICTCAFYADGEAWLEIKDHTHNMQLLITLLGVYITRSALKINFAAHVTMCSFSSPDALFLGSAWGYNEPIITDSIKCPIYFQHQTHYSIYQSRQPKRPAGGLARLPGTETLV